MTIWNRPVATPRGARFSFSSKVLYVFVCCTSESCSERVDIDEAILLQSKMTLRDFGIYEMACVVLYCTFKLEWSGILEARLEASLPSQL